MKKIILCTTLLFISAAFFYSCRKDLSTYNDNKIDGVKFDTTGQSTLNIFQFDTLQLKPKLDLSKLNEGDLSFEWKINIEPGTLEYMTVGTSRDLSFPIELKPNPANRPYQLLYTVTDKNTGLQYIMAWPLTVRNSIGEGLVIAETADNSTTDISHIMSPLVTPDYDKTSVKHNIFSTINGHTIPGVLAQLRYTKLKGAGGVMMGMSSNTIVAVKTADYTLAAADDDLFYTDVPNRQHQMIGGVIQSDVYVGNGKLTAVWLEINSRFGVPFDSKFVVPDIVALNGNNDYPATVVNFYEEEKGLFVYQPSVSSFGDRNMYGVESSTSAGFDPSDLPGKKNLAASVNLDGDFLHVLKDKSSNNVGLYIIEGGKYDDDYNFIAPKAKAYYDLTSAPEIQNAKRFVFMDDQKILYYATDTKIYAVIYSTSAPIFSERYTANGSEEITTLQVYRQADYPKRIDGWDPPYISTNNKQLIMSTYDGSEGKVYILPIINFGVGNIDKANSKVFGGFKKITAIATQL